MNRGLAGVSREEALLELQNTIEDVFYTASLFRSLGDAETAMRLGDLGDKFHEEYLRIKTGAKPS